MSKLSPWQPKPGPDAIDFQIVEMRRDGLSRNGIAEVLAISRAAVDNRIKWIRNRTDIDVTVGNRAAPQWVRRKEAPDEIDEKIIASRAAGMSRLDGARAVRMSASAYDQRVAWLITRGLTQALRNKKTRAGKNSKPKQVKPLEVFTDRRCLRCRTDFPSFGAGNRICRNCKHSEEWEYGNAASISAATTARSRGF